MSRLMPAWRHACLLVAGTLVVTGCGSEGASSGSAVIRSQGSALQQGADLVITEVKTPPDARLNTSFVADVRVCNRGTVSSPPAEAAIVISTQATLDAPTSGPIPPTQARVGQALVPSLDAGRCVLVRTQASAQRPPDAFAPGQPLYVGAIVDPSTSIPELREDNNTHVAGRMGVGDGPDLVVTEVTGPTSFQQGFTSPLSVTVCNVGSERAPEVSADVLLSTLPTMPPQGQTPDPESALTITPYVHAQGLDAGRCVTLSKAGSAIAPTSWQPNTPLYLGARVEEPRFVPELRTDNNTFVKGLVGLGNGPDLMVRSLKAAANVAPGMHFPVEATVCNVGTADLGGSARLQLALSSESAVVFPALTAPFDSRTQVPVGSADVSVLSAGQCKTLTVDAIASRPQEAGPYQALALGAVIDANRTVPELREDNNVLTQGLVGVGFDADLVITDVKAPANLRDGQPFTASYTVCNVGLSPASSTGVAMYLSVDAAPPAVAPWQSQGPLPGYAFLGRSSINTDLTPGQCTTQSGTFHALRPMELGPLPLSSTLNLSAVMDGPPDARTDNNGFAVGPVGVGNGPDLVVTELQGPASARPNAPFTSNVRVCNVGTQPSPGTSQVAVYLGTGNTLPAPLAQSGSPPSPDGTVALVGTVSVPSLGEGACVTQSLTGPAALPAQATPLQPLYLGAVVDPGAPLQELREDNNTFVAGLMGVGHGADLVVTGLTFPDTVAPMEPFTATARLCNTGTEGSSITPVMFVVSAEANGTMPAPGVLFPSMDQYLAGQLNAPSLQAGQCQDVPVTLHANRPWSAPVDAPLYLSAVVDPFQNQLELRRDNNVSPGRRLGVGTGPDLVITSLTGPASAFGPLDLGVTVCNLGSQAVPAPRVTLHLLTKPSLTLPAPNVPVPMEELLGEATLPPVAAHACVTQTVNAFISGAGIGMPGTQTFFLGASVDRMQQVPEVREDNNTFVGPRIGVGFAADVVITAMGGPDQVQPWAAMLVPVTVCNQGTMLAQPHTVDLLLSTVATLPASAVQGEPVESPTLSRPGSVQVPPLAVGECVSVEGSVNAVPPQAAQPGAALYLGASARLYDSELRKDNNGFVRGTLTVSNTP